MKRAVTGVLAIVAVVWLGSLSAPLLDGSCLASTSKGTTAPGTIAPVVGGSTDPAGSSGGGSGGTNQGDADGLSGFVGGHFTIWEENAAPVSVDRVMVLVGMWWRTMIWIR